MISKYFLRSLVVALNILLFTSCLGSSDDNFEYSPDAQIYSFSMSSRGDTLNLLNTTAFTIDQVNGKIFNKDPMPYLFHVDSVVLNISSSSTLNPFSQVVLTLSDESDNPFYWSASDSVAINRLKKITTIAPDGQSTKEYSFQLNIYQEDPYVLAWEEKADYSSVPSVPPVNQIADQKTIAFNQQFITYYKTETTIGAVSTNNDGTSWNPVTLTGLPATAQLKSLLAMGQGAYVLDENGSVYKSANGAEWNEVPLDNSVATIYGILPSATAKRILLAVDDGGTLHFALTDDFSDIQLMNEIPDDIPLSDFTATSMESPTSFGAKHIILTGGVKKDDTQNNDIWLLHENNNKITDAFIPTTGISVAGSSLFYYDNRLYLMIVNEKGENSFLLSDYGLAWAAAKDNQAFPESGFTSRTNASVVIDDDNNIWIFGGISAASPQAQLVDVWKGRLNKFSMN